MGGVSFATIQIEYEYIDIKSVFWNIDGVYSMFFTFRGIIH